MSRSFSISNPAVLQVSQETNLARPGADSPPAALSVAANVESLTFSSIDIGQLTSMQFNVVVSGSGTETITITSSSSEFYVVGDGSYSISVADSVKYVRTIIGFAPTSYGTKTATLTITSSGGATDTVQLEGACVDTFFSSTSLLLKADGANNSTTFVDSSPNNLTISRLGNAKISTAQSKYGGSSAYFDGSGDYLTVAANNAFEFGTGDFTIESWVHLTNNNIAYQMVASIAWGTGKAVQLRYGDAGFGYKLQVTVQSSSSAVVWSTAATQTTHRNTWVHLAFTRASGVCRLFVNGVVQNINSGTPSTYPFTSFTDTSNITGNIGLAVGANRIGTNALFGYLDDVRITKGVARYTANFTPPDSLPTTGA